MSPEIEIACDKKMMLGKWVSYRSFPNGAIVIDRASYRYNETVERLIHNNYDVVRKTPRYIQARVRGF